MNNRPLLLAAIGALAVLNGCQSSPTEESATLPAERSGRLSLRVEAGPVGVLARGAATAPTRLILRFSSPDLSDLVDTISVSGGNPIPRDYSLAGGRTWTLSARSLDARDSLLHMGTETFRVGSDSTTNLLMSLDARYSSLGFRFPVRQNFTRIFVAVDGAVWCDSTPAHIDPRTDSIKVERDYLTASRGGVRHELSLRVTGDRGDKDTLLYALDTTIEVVSGVSRNHRLTLKWVGTGGVKAGWTDLEIGLGAVGSISYVVDYPDPQLACGTWKDESGFPWNPAIRYGTLCDVRDGKVYRTVVIGSQRWMAENLNYAGTQPRLGYCEDGQDCQVYGRHYDWSESMAGEPGRNRSPSGVRGICPAGWHIPSHEEWLSLGNFVDGSNTAASVKLRALSSWNRNDGTDQYGFRVLGGGFQLSNMPIILGKGDVSRFWSASPADPSTVWTMEFSSSTPEIAALGLDPWRGHHLRCLQD